jgi:predicted transcriptional regulator YdeE
MLTLSKTEIIEHEPFLIVGAYCPYEGDDEEPGWSGAFQAFHARQGEITNRKGDLMFGFLYRPHRDDPGVPQSIRSCFIGVEVTDFDHVPEGLTTTQFPGGNYVTVACRGDTEDEAAIGVGQGVRSLETWITDHGYREGDACFACSHEDAATPPFVEYVYIHFIER